MSCIFGLRPRRSIAARLRPSASSALALLPSTRQIPSPRLLLLPQRRNLEYISNAYGKPRRLSAEQVPGAAVWEKALQSLVDRGMAPQAAGLRPDEAISAMVRYIQAVESVWPKWTPNVALKSGLGSRELHLIGCVLMFGGHSAAPASVANRLLGHHMLVTAALLGFGPSLVTLLSVGLQGPPPFWTVESGPIITAGGSDPAMLAPIIKVFKEQFRSAEAKVDPNTLTAAGVLFIHEGEEARGVRWLLEAVRLGGLSTSSSTAPDESTSSTPPPSSPSASADASTVLSPAEQLDLARFHAAFRTIEGRQPKWDMELKALLTLGAVHVRQGRRDEAEALFRTAAFELDAAEGFSLLSTLLPESSREREACLLKAAVSGLWKAGELLADLELVKAEESVDAGDVHLTKMHHLVASEWRRIAAAG